MIETITVRPPPTRPAATAPTIGGSPAALPSIAPAPPAASVATASADKAGFSLWGDDGFGFGDFLDAINPLQHIPVLGTLYREFVGDDIGVASKLVGGALFAGIPGLIGSAVDAAFEAVSGKDIGATALALVGLGREGGADGRTTTLAAKTLGETGGKTGGGNIPTLAATQFENLPALLTQADEREPKNATRAFAPQAAAMQAQNFAARFDYEISAYRHGQRLLSQNTPSLETSA